MKALVVGGTSGYGKEVTEQLLGRKYDLATVSRSEAPYDQLHYCCDVGDLAEWENTLRTMKSDLCSIDLLVCVVGYAQAKRSRELRWTDWDKSFAQNLTYVGMAFNELVDSLDASPDPRVITMGSQWSYKIGCDFFQPYIVAKHGLRTLTEELASQHPKIKINHYCPPTMNTPTYWRIREEFKALGEEDVIKDFGLTEPKIVATAVVNQALTSHESGLTFVIAPDGAICRI